MTSCELLWVLWFACAIFLLFAHHLCRMLTFRAMLCSVNNPILYLKGGILLVHKLQCCGCLFHKVQVLTRRASVIFHAFNCLFISYTTEKTKRRGKKKKNESMLHREQNSSCFSGDFVLLLGIAHLHAHTCPFPLAEVCPAEEMCCLQDRGAQRVHGAVREGETLPSSGAWRSQHAFDSREVSAWKALCAKLNFHGCFKQCTCEQKLA